MKTHTLAECMDVFDWFDDPTYEYIHHILLAKLDGEKWYLFFRHYHAGLIASIAGRNDVAAQELKAALAIDDSPVAVVDAATRALARMGDQAGAKAVIDKATCIGCAVSGLGGLYYVMDYANGVWSNNGFGDRGWLAIALVIFAVWKPDLGILGSFLFGGLMVVHNYIPNLSFGAQELFMMTPYVVTIIVLVAVSMRRKRENLPPASLGLSYFREDR